MEKDPLPWNVTIGISKIEYIVNKKGFQIKDLDTYFDLIFEEIVGISIAL